MGQIGLFDGCFGHQRSATLGGMNVELSAQHFHWERNIYGEYATFYTDMHLEYAIGAPGLKVAWLIEPPSLSDSHYQKAVALEDEFDYILTFCTEYLSRGDKWLYYPLGGSWIKPDVWGIPPKTRMASLIASEKVGAVGHRLRHAVAARFPGKLNVMGRGYRPIGEKTEGLYDYMYSVVIESVQTEAYFSEKLIDCFTLGTVPIYWGCLSIGDFFDVNGMLLWDGNLDTLEQILNHVISRKDYTRRRKALEWNLIESAKYTCAEDWIYRNYPWLFNAEIGKIAHE